jgi:transposase
MVDGLILLIVVVFIYYIKGYNQGKICDRCGHIMEESKTFWWCRNCGAVEFKY